MCRPPRAALGGTPQQFGMSSPSSCKIAIIVVKGGPVSGCPTYSSSSKQFQFNLKVTSAMKGSNSVSITVTVGGTVVTVSAVDPFTVK
jgi:hypothetical protein